MTKQKAPLPEGKLEEAANAVGLHKIHEEEFFKTPAKSTEFDDLCNGIDIKVGSKHKEAKELCINLVHRLEKLSKDNPPKHNEYCSYLRYWLYEKIGEIHEDKSANVDKVPFFKHLIEAWGKMNSGKLQSKCLPDKLTTPVKLSELKNRIFSYIYFKNLEKIKTISTSENQDNCTKFLTYLESFKLVHDKYKSAQCGIFSWTSNKTDYFSCDHKHKLTSLMTELQKCKNGDKEKLKAVASGPDRSKVVAAAAPAGDQKVSGGATQSKASVAVTSSSSSSTAVTTSPAVSTTKVTTLSTPATTTSTVAAAKPVTITTQAKTTSAATTTNTVTTTSSSSQRRSWIWPSFFSSSSSPRTSALGASQTSTSTSGSTVSARQVTTTSASSGRGSPVTVTTNSPRVAGSISSTGQGVLTSPLATGVEHGKSLSPQLQGSPGYPLNSVSSNNLNIGGDSPPATITDVPGTSETLYDKLDSNTVKNIVMAAAVLGIIFFLFYYNRSSRIESSIKPKKRKNKAFEHNYYEEYEKELARYESDNESLDSLDDRYYLTYQPDQDSHY
ncbi:hypothetical protein PVNG_05848 [Plasmodium vivax North Korean]|uniref:Variable surface protein Vir12-like protein n=1 Tax=Plasmodium vivax North Korean TaxID=1035514 RepID=A0A0J9TN53_PLAVI|nr:hypothetical protein PVNG_05848 [Plasmodium vivax North Korean]